MSYIPSLTLPPVFFSSPALAIGFPITCGLINGLLSQPGSSKLKTLSSKSTAEKGADLDATKQQYLALKQPPGNPPPYVFAPVWTTLYGLMGFASHRAWVQGMASAKPQVIDNVRLGATLYTVQLVLNQAFMPLFFKLGQPIPALVDIATLTGTVGYLTYTWSKVDETAAYCMVPYVAWLTYATYLTAGTGYLNGWSTSRVDGELVTKGRKKQ